MRSNLKEREQQPQPAENLGSFYMGRMRQTPEPRRVLPRGLLTLVILFAFGSIIWYAYPQGQERYSDIDIPVISADKAAYKFKPDNPGGMEVLHQDSTVFEPLEKKSADNVERLLPAPEKPMEKPEAKAEPKPETATAAPVTAAPAPAASPIEAKPSQLDLKAVSASAAGSDEDGDSYVVSNGPLAPESASVPEKAAEKPRTENLKAEAPKAEPAKPQPKTETAKAPAAAKAASAAKAAASIAGNEYIQIGAYRDETAAAKDWRMLQKKFPGMLGKLNMRTNRADLGAKGIYYRLQAGRVSDARAKDICAALKAGGHDGCIVVK